MSAESMEFWKNLFEIAGVVLLLLTFIAGAGVLWFSRKLNAVQAEQLRQFDKGLTDAKWELGKQQERAAIAEKALKGVDTKAEGFRFDIAKANQRAAEAQTTAKGFEKDIAVANRQAAEATRIAEEEKLARVKIEERFSPRRLTLEQQERIVEKIRPFAGQQFSFSVYPDPESIDLLGVIDKILKAAGWIRIDSQIGDITVEGAGIIYATGVFVDVAPENIEDKRSAIRALAESLSIEGVAATPRKNTQLTGKNKNSINVSIGRKP